MSTRTERACMLCGIIKPYSTFRKDGCINCESLLHFQENDENISECTSPSFEGLVALGRENRKSWVARWLRIDTFEPGLYAVKVNGKLSPEYIGKLEDNNIIYRPRDGSAND
ncbi:unnamed protein product [Candida verbasci]|uniref:Transcription elongation factor SPT4 n=1 Tax=Candida verbasci TaxID=1227364 RepID=A0A9W4XBP8_9ASCO|nr:unnamed protein product [Candida verbasci]